MAMNLDGYVFRKTEVVLGTEKFTFTELTMGDLAEFRAELVQKQETLRDKRRERLMADAEKIGGVDPMELLKILDKSISEDEVDEAMETTEGVTHLAYLSLRHSHPEISRKQVADIITTSDIEQVTKAMFPSQAEKADKKKVKKKALAR